MICSYHGLYHAPTPQKRFIAPIFNRTQIWLYKHYANRIILVENFSKKYLLKMVYQSKNYLYATMVYLILQLQ